MRRAVVGVFLSVCSLVVQGEVPSPLLMRAVYTMPHELDVLFDSGHVQGACCSKDAVYLSHMKGLEKLDWSGRLLKHVDAPMHLGDTAFYKGKVYGVFGLRKATPSGKQGMVRVWDEDLNVLQDAYFDELLDGCTVLNGVLYVGVNRWDVEPHDLCCLKKIDVTTLADLGNADVDLNYRIQYGVQTMANDGKNLILGNYGAPRESGNPKSLHTSLLSPDFTRTVGMSLDVSEGFDFVPSEVSGGKTPVVFAVRALGGNMQGWRKDPVGNPPQIRLDFYEWGGNGFVRDMTLRGESDK